MTNRPLQAGLEALPHGPEFRFLDRVMKLEPGRSAAAEFTLRGDEYFLRGHFPGQPMLPGVLLVEAAAQLAGIVAQTDPQIPRFPLLRLTAIRSAKILGTAVPGQRVLLEARLEGRLGNLIQVAATATVNGLPILQTHLTLTGDSPAEPARPVGT